MVAFVLAVDLLAVAGFVLLFGQHVADPWMGTFLLGTLVALAGAVVESAMAVEAETSAVTETTRSPNRLVT